MKPKRFIEIQKNLVFLNLCIFNQRIEQLRKYKLYKTLSLHTNGILLTPKILDFLKESDLKHMVFNFPSAIEEEWSTQMGMHKKHFLPTLDNILSFCESFKNVQVTIEMNQKLFYDKPEEYREGLTKIFDERVYFDLAPLKLKTRPILSFLIRVKSFLDTLLLRSYLV